MKLGVKRLWAQFVSHSVVKPARSDVKNSSFRVEEEVRFVFLCSRACANEKLKVREPISTFKGKK